MKDSDQRIQSQMTLATEYRIVWVHPGRSRCVSIIEGNASGESPLRIGTTLRNGDMLGDVVSGREYDCTALDAQSVLVKCTHAIDDKVDLKKVHVWYAPACQVLEGALLLAAQTEPIELLMKFRQIEDKIEQDHRDLLVQQRNQRESIRKAKKMPGKR